MSDTTSGGKVYKSMPQKDITNRQLARMIRGLSRSMRVSNRKLMDMVGSNEEKLVGMIKQSFDHVDDRLTVMQADMDTVKADVDVLKTDVSDIKLRLGEAAWHFEMVELDHRVTRLEYRTGIRKK